MLVAEHYGTLLLHAIHEDAEWTREADVAHIVGFFYGRHSVEDILAEDRSEEHTSELQSRI